MWCKHKYDDVHVRFTPPHNITNIKAQGSREHFEFAQYALYGCSVITQKCNKCGKAHSYTVPGDAT